MSAEHLQNVERMGGSLSWCFQKKTQFAFKKRLWGRKGEGIALYTIGVNIIFIGLREHTHTFFQRLWQDF